MTPPRKVTVLLVVTLVLLLGPANSAQAILNGQPDGNRHPYVGLVDNGEFACSGSAISPTIFITAAHCFDHSGEQVEVTFDSEGFFAQNPVFYTGRWYPDPQFCIGCAHGLPGFDTHDVAVVVLDQPVNLPQYAQLPTPGLVDTLAMGTRVTLVGYGVQHFARGGGPPQPDAFFTRFFAPASLIQSNHSISDEFIKVSANPAQGSGGTCFGDSGGPVLLGNTNTILAITSFGTNGVCAGVGYYYRIDISQSLNFINQFL